MNWFDNLKQQLGLQAPARHPNQPTNTPLRERLEAGQRAKRAEDYGQALHLLGDALTHARNLGDITGIIIASLNIAEVHALQGHYAEAETIIAECRQTALESRQRGQIAYLLAELGQIAQKQEQWEQAQSRYEEALQIARVERVVGAEGRTMGYLADVYAHDGNLTYAVHLLREALPKLNLTGDIELSTYFVGRLGQLLVEMGQTTEGTQLIERGLRLAHQLAYRRYERHWNIVLANMALVHGQNDQCLNYLNQAMRLFDGNKPLKEYVGLLFTLTRAYLALDQAEEALQYGRLGARLASQLQNERSAVQGDTLFGIVLIANNLHETAIPYLEMAVEVAPRLNAYPPGYTETDVYRQLATAYNHIGDLAAAVRSYKEAIARAERASNRLEVAQCQRDLGLLYSDRNKMKEAIQEWSAALTIYETERQPAQAARLYCSIAAARSFIGQTARAMKDYEQALVLLNSLNEDWETRGLVLANAALAFVNNGDLDSADSFFNESIAIARRLNDFTAEAIRRGNYGYFLLVTGRMQQAVSTLEYALRLSKEYNLTLPVALQTDNLGIAQDWQANYDRGLALHDEALTMLDSEDSTHWRAVFCLNRVNSLIGLQRWEEAEQCLAQVVPAEQTIEDYLVTVRSRLLQARLHIKQSRYQDADAGLREALNLAQRGDLRREQAECYYLLSEQQAGLQQAAQAQQYWEQAKKLFTLLHSPEASLHPGWLPREAQQFR
jgi:tetratricopeptide (TPR) repeat protein